ncbi:MAG: NUDIX hydrolase [Candidatus Sacchiramonaceae bacterium]|nr:NUDIX hydrolase [Candidatus Saccharimonadaceae bacterium]
MNEITHHIQKSILKYLTTSKTARYSEMRPRKVDSNLYAYHLKKLVNLGFITQENRKYTLTPAGINYVEAISLEKFNIRSQPKITTRILLKNHKNQYLLTKRIKQPMIEMWGFPSGKIHNLDDRIVDAARRELHEKTGVNLRILDHVGDYYARIVAKNEVISNTFSHVFLSHISIPEYEAISATANTNLQWCAAEEIPNFNIIPDTLDLIYLSNQADGRFFAELEYEI